MVERAREIIHDEHVFSGDESVILEEGCKIRVIIQFFSVIWKIISSLS
jgi:hypothetical protein